MRLKDLVDRVQEDNEKERAMGGEEEGAGPVEKMVVEVKGEGERQRIERGRRERKRERSVCLFPRSFSLSPELPPKEN